MGVEPFVPHGVPVTDQLAYWCGSLVALSLVGYVAYLIQENRKLKMDKDNEVVTTIKDSINNLSTTIKESTEKFENALKETRAEFAKGADDMWTHIGELREEVSWLTGQHEVNHKIKYEAPEHKRK